MAFIKYGEIVMEQFQMSYDLKDLNTLHAVFNTLQVGYGTDDVTEIEKC